MQTLTLLLEHEERARDDAARRLQQAQAQAQRAREQAAMLETYRHEYCQRWSAQFARGGSVPIVQCYQGFVERLQQAITQQQREAERTAAHVEHCRLQLQAQQVRVASVRKLIERRTQEIQRAAARRDQKRLDEAAARLHAGRAPWHAGDAQPTIA